MCIVGLGLMGGSMALALKLAHRMAIQPFDLHLSLVDQDPQTLSAVQNLGDIVTDSFAEGVRDAELLILATPVRAIVSLLELLPSVHKTGCMVIDLGSSKVAIGEAMAALPSRFSAIGGHPMCGRETPGFRAATPDLYRDRNFVLCANRRTTPRMQMQATVLLDLIGAHPIVLQAKFHDELVASISHLPYVVSGALMRTVAGMDNDIIWSLSASGFRDTSRISGTDPTMMLDILLTNKTAVLAQINRYQTHINDLVTLLKNDDEAGLRHWLETSRTDYLAYKARKPN